MATITSLSTFYFRIRRFFLLEQTKKSLLWAMVAPQAVENHGDKTLDLIFRMINLCINSNLDPPTNISSSSRRTEFKDILPWNIFWVITKTIPTSTEIVTSYAIKCILFWVWLKVSGNWDNNMIRMSQWRESHYRTNACIRRY